MLYLIPDAIQMNPTSCRLNKIYVLYLTVLAFNLLRPVPFLRLYNSSFISNTLLIIPGSRLFLNLEISMFSC